MDDGTGRLPEWQVTAGEGGSDEVIGLAALALEIALRRVQEHEAQEIAQSAIAAYLQGREHVDNPAAYVTRVTYNLILELQEHRRHYLLVGDLPDVADDAVEDESSRVLDRLLAKVFVEEEVDGVLTERQRRTLALAYEAGLSREEIARHLDIKPETVKDTLRRVKRKIHRNVGTTSLWRLSDG